MRGQVRPSAQCLHVYLAFDLVIDVNHLNMSTFLSLSLTLINVKLARKSKHTYRRHVVAGAHLIVQQSVANFPGEDGGALALIVRNLGHHVRGGHPRLAAADRPRPYRARLIVSAQYLRHTTIGHLGVGDRVRLGESYRNSMDCLPAVSAIYHKVVRRCEPARLSSGG